MNTFSLKLFVAGRTPRAERAIADLRVICEQVLDSSCEITVIDVLEQPQLAEKEKIMATPTLIREHPLPRRRIIGDLSDTQKVLAALGIIVESDEERA